MKIDVACKSTECESNKDGNCDNDLGITINAEGICDDYYEES